VVLLLSVLCALCLGTAHVTAKRGLGAMDARAGAAISISTATAVFVIVSPIALDLSGLNLLAVGIFAAVGLIYPALSTLVTFEANDRLGATVTSAVSGTAPVFALVGAAVFVGEVITAQAIIASIGVALGIAVFSWRRGALRAGFRGYDLLFPLIAAIARGTGQALAKTGLTLWPNPFAASIISYVIASAAVVTVNRAPLERRISRQGARWFILTGALNCIAVMALYTALSRAPVSYVAPIIATFPLVTAALSAALGQERLTVQNIVGSLISVSAVIILVSS